MTLQQTCNHKHAAIIILAQSDQPYSPTLGAVQCPRLGASIYNTYEHVYIYIYTYNVHATMHEDAYNMLI